MYSRRTITKLRRWLKDKLYHEETGYLLNYLTLHISDPVIEEQLKEYRGT